MTKQNKRADNAPRQELKMYNPDEVIIIGVDTKDGPNHWGYDEESNKTPLVEADVRFTYERGIIQNVLARRDGDRLIIVAGRGRTRQLREANKRRIADGLDPWFLPVRIVRGDEREMRALKHGENSHRREQTPFATAQRALELSQHFPEDKAADIMGLGVAQFRNVLKLLDVGADVKKAVQQGKLGQTAAIELAALPEAQQSEQLAALLAATEASGSGGKIKARDVKAKVREAQGKPAMETPSHRIKKVLGILDKLEDSATKDELLATIKKIRHALK